MRRAIAQLTQRSNAEVPHFHGSVVIDMTESKALLKQVAAIAEKNGWAAPTITDLVLRAAALALRQTPALNVSFRGEEILYYDDIHLGLVIGLAEGMLVPVVHHADRLNLVHDGRDHSPVAQRGRSRTTIEFAVKRGNIHSFQPGHVWA